EHRNGKEWVQAGTSANGKPRYAWVWPKDGKHQNWLGRWKDIMTGHGPDIHVAINVGMRQRKENSATKAQWSRWNDLADSTGEVEGPKAPLFWAKRGSDQWCDFRKRKYVRPNKRSWTNAKWENATAKCTNKPKAFRDVDGQHWEQQHSWP
ncbi:hypothetical protein B0J12DRAFT_537837, partial [Macrophomina phaseolina]